MGLHRRWPRRALTDPRLLLPPLITVLIHATLGAKQGARVPKGFIVLSGTGIKDTREWVPSATEALRLVKIHMKLRRPGVRIEDERGKSAELLPTEGKRCARGAQENALRVAASVPMPPIRRAPL